VEPVETTRKPHRRTCGASIVARKGSPVAAAIRQKFLNFTGLELRRVRVLYGGGEILFPSGSAGPTVFLGCTFVLSVPGEPPKRGKELIGNLLAAMDLSNVSMQIPG